MAGTIAAGTVDSGTSSTPPIFKANGTEIGQLCRMWVNFNGSAGTITASFNFSSITKNGTGDYSFSFYSMADANYAFSGGGKLSVYNNFDVPAFGYYRNTSSPATSSSFRMISCNLNPGAEDAVIGSLVIFR